jgi:hypothetical protein
VANETLATIRDKVRKRGDYPTSAVFTDAYVNTEIQASWAELYELVDDVSEGWWDTTGTVVTVDAQAYVALPADCWRVKGVDLLVGSEYVAMRQIGTGDRNRFGASTARPVAYRTTARGLDLFPTPNGVYTIRVTYAPVAPALIEGTERNYINHWDEYIIVSTLLKLDEREERETASRINALDRVAFRIRSSATKRRQAEPEYLNLRGGGLGGFDFSDLEDIF